MTSFLQSKGLFKFVTRRAKDLKDRAQLDEDLDMLETILDNDEKTLGHIKCHISSSFLELVLTCNTAKEAWDNLTTFFEGKEAFNKFNLLEQLMDGKLVETGKVATDVQQFLKEKNELVRRLQAIGFQVPEDFLIAIILARLPASFDTMRRIFESQPDPTVLKLSAELNKEAVRRQKRPREEKALVSEVDRELAPPPTKKPKKPKNPKANETWCKDCNVTGHTLDKCWFNPSSSNYRPDMLKKLLKMAQAAANHDVEMAQNE